MNTELINYRRQRAKETLTDAKNTFNNTSLFTTVNRIYYAVFYEVLALLLTKDLSSSKHTGVRALFHREFVKLNLVDVKYADFYNRMFEFRHKADYGDFVEFEEEKVEQWLKEADNFMEALEYVIEQSLG